MYANDRGLGALGAAYRFEDVFVLNEYGDVTTFQPLAYRLQPGDVLGPDTKHGGYYYEVVSSSPTTGPQLRVVGVDQPASIASDQYFNTVTGRYETRETLEQAHARMAAEDQAKLEEMRALVNRSTGITKGIAKTGLAAEQLRQAGKPWDPAIPQWGGDAFYSNGVKLSKEAQLAWIEEDAPPVLVTINDAVFAVPSSSVASSSSGQATTTEPVTAVMVTMAHPPILKAGKAPKPAKAPKAAKVPKIAKVAKPSSKPATAAIADPGATGGVAHFPIVPVAIAGAAFLFLRRRRRR